MGRLFAVILLVAVLGLGGGIIASTAYQAGVDTAITTSVADGTVVTPVVVPAYGVGWHGAGFGIFGLLATLFFLFIVFGLLRAVFFWGRGDHGRWGGARTWGGPDGWARTGDHDDEGHGRWERHARDTFDTWHRLAHDASAVPPTDAGAPGGGPAGQA